MTTPQPVAVSDADRRRAVRIMADRWNDKIQTRVLIGECDHYIAVQECARHRLAAERELEALRDALEKIERRTRHHQDDTPEDDRRDKRIACMIARDALDKIDALKEPRDD